MEVMDGASAEELVPIGEVGRRFGIAVSTLRCWDERGLVHPAARHGGRRWYGPDELHRIGLIQVWQDTGLMSLEEIAAVLTGTGKDHNWRAVVLERIHAIDAQMRRLVDGKAHLEHLLTCPSDNPAEQCTYLRRFTTERMAGRPVSPEQLRAWTAHEPPSSR